MKYQPQLTGLMPLLMIYLGIGCIVGLFEYGIALHAFRDHPHKDSISHQDLFLTCVLKNAVAWPVILFWLCMLGLLKLYILLRGGK